MIDIARVRLDTKACQNNIFLNSAGASLPPEVVTDTVIDYLQKEAIIGGYQQAQVYEKQIQQFYINTATLLNTKSSNIAFCFNSTDAFSRAVSSIPFEVGDKVLVSDDDYISNYFLFMTYQKRFGIEIIRLNNLPNGEIDLEDVEQKIVRFRPKLVSVTHIPTNSGKIQDVESIGNLCEKYGIWYIVDACQSCGQILVDVQSIKCDFLCATGRKFLRGPRGTGFLYVSDKVLESGLSPLMLDMRGATWETEDSYFLEKTAKRFELWEANYANLLGLSEAINYANQIGISNIQNHNLNLCNLLKSQLSKRPNIRITEENNQNGSIVTFTSSKYTLEEVKNKLIAKNIFFGVGFRQYALIDFNKKDVDWVIRFSPHYFNTEDEILRAVDALK
jgi:selenocysteine lyase/cysteine desulfurase